MRLLKKAPLFLILLISGIFFFLTAVLGRNTVYAQIPLEPEKQPVLSVVFRGLKEGIHPLQVFDSERMHDEVQKEEVSESAEVKQEETVEGMPEQAKIPVLNGESQQKPIVDKEAVTKVEEGEIQAAVIPTAEPVPYSIKNIRTEPLRESTREEYLNHISADIYGDTGVLRAAEYAFEPVTENYFDDALFIGDSRTVGLRDYTDLSDHAIFLCETSLTIQKVFTREFKGKGTLEEVLAAGDFGKIYLMLGINELGLGTTEDYMASYTAVIDRIHELEPEALIFIQANMHVAEEKSKTDKIFNNQNIEARNRAIATLSDNIQVFYIDVNEAVSDENGYLKDEYTYDKIHLLGRYNDIWKQFLLTKGVKTKSE